jgi:hypothetical protein
MKTGFVILLSVLLSCIATYSQEQMRVMDGQMKKRWQTNTFGSLSFGNTWFSGGNSTAVSASVGIQHTRQLNNNLYAFGRLSAAPTYFSFNSAFNNPGFNKLNTGNGLFNNSNFGVYPRAEAGLFYINNEKTFSISGSMFIERGTNFYYPTYGIGNGPVQFFK